MRWRSTPLCPFETCSRTFSHSIRAKRRIQENAKTEFRQIEEQLNQLSSAFVDFDNIQPLAEEERTVEVITASKDPDTEEKTQSQPMKRAQPVKKEPVFTVTRFKRRSHPSFFSEKSFEDVGLSFELQEAVTSIGIERPSQIQVHHQTSH